MAKRQKIVRIYYVDCSELSLLLSDIAMDVASTLGVSEIDSIVHEMKKELPDIDRSVVVEAIREAHTAEKKDLTDLQKLLAVVKKEAGDDKRLHQAISRLEIGILSRRVPAKPPTSAIAALRARRNALRKQLDRMDPRHREKVLRRIAELDQHLKEGTFPEKRVRPAAPADLAALRLKRDKLRNTLTRLRDSASPKVIERLETSIYSLEQHLAAGTHPVPKDKPSVPTNIAALRKERDSLNRELQRDNPARRQRLHDKIAELEGHLAAGTLPERGPKSRSSPRMRDLKRRVSDLRDAIKDSDPAIRDKYEKKIASLTKVLERPPAIPEKKEAKLRSREIELLDYEATRLQRKIRHRIEASRPMTPWTFIARDVLGPARVLTAFADLSATTIQGGFYLFSHPMKALPATAKAIRSLVSPEYAHRVWRSIESRPNFQWYVRGKVPFTSDQVDVRSQEEEFQNVGWARKVPGVMASSRAFETYLNLARADMFDAMFSGFTTKTARDAKGIGWVTGILTARPSLGFAERAAEFLNTIYWSPRKVLGNFQTTMLYPLWAPRRDVSVGVRLAASRQYAQFAIGVLVFYGFLKMMFGDDVDWAIDEHPTSPYYGMIRIRDTYYDPFGGMLQAIRFSAKLATGERMNRRGEVVPLVGDDRPYGATSMGETVFRFHWSKNAPVPGLVTSIVARENYMGDPVLLTEPETLVPEIADRMLPMAPKAVTEGFIREGFKPSSAKYLAEFFGIRVVPIDESEASGRTRTRPRRERATP